MKKLVFTLVVFLLRFSQFQAQNPYAALGIEEQVLRYDDTHEELFGNDTLKTIGYGIYSPKLGLSGIYDLNDSLVAIQKIDPSKMARFLSLDPLTKEYPWYTPYQFAGNMPIKYIDLDGLEPAEPGNASFMAGMNITNPAASNAEVKFQNRDVDYQYQSKALLSGMISPFVSVGSGLGAVPNQVSVIYNEGIHEGEAFNDESYLYPPGIYGFDLNNGGIFKYGDAKEGKRALMFSTFGVTLTGLTMGMGGGNSSGLTLAPKNTTIELGLGRAANFADDAASVLSGGDYLRIQNAASKINKPITLVGSRASGTAKAYSDWDYVIPGLNSKNWSSIKNSLPGSRSVMDNTPRNIDIFKGPVDVSKPHITINPRQ